MTASGMIGRLKAVKKSVLAGAVFLAVTVRAVACRRSGFS